MNALTPQMQTYSTLQIKIRHKIKLLTHSKGASLDILIISYSQLTSLELSLHRDKASPDSARQTLPSTNEGAQGQAGLRPNTRSGLEA